MNHPYSVLALLLALSLLPACKEEKAVRQQNKMVQVVTVHPTPLHTKKSTLGTVRARYESELSFRTDGKIVARLVEVGDHVQAGQILARLDPSDHELALQAAEDQLRVAQIDAKQASVDEARLQRLLRDRSVADADHERQKAKAAAAAAQQAQAKRQRDLADHQHAYTTLTAHRAGIITSVRFESGQMVNEGQPIVTLASPDEWEMVVDLPESVVAQNKPLQAVARFWVNSLPETPLVLRELAAQAAPTSGTFRSRFRMPQEAALRQAGLRLGMSATVHLESQDGPLASPLPASALLKNSAAPFVWIVVNGSQLQQRPVTLLRQENDSVWLDGLQEGEQVVVTGGFKLDAALPVQAINSDPSRLTQRSVSP
ncbi:efflux RND transporter periplasmic adaptor subunit [Candidatus Magnetaquicoccus inordinatus]|uniref:efflux RND transporter periplasmic adaptor subunit n=1 Tax=Candidatus Magnetaquicoccus inordinatus TaxID=2496818 RepID=UPI00102BD2BB|nr:efflux RND transporter periplasmic adaptor subunit [Candidatus Magnetaquicoccus inordinatus]